MQRDGYTTIAKCAIIPACVHSVLLLPGMSALLTIFVASSLCMARAATAALCDMYTLSMMWQEGGRAHLGWHREESKDAALLQPADKVVNNNEPKYEP